MEHAKKGFVKFSREITEWRWYHDHHTFIVFFHLVLTANYKDGDFGKVTVHRGQKATSYESLARETGLSVQNVRTAIVHLKSTGEISVKSCNKFSIITVCNYEEYQGNERKASKKKPENSNSVNTTPPTGTTYI